jgi:uncharacterized protein (TIGR02646 family)
MQISMIRINKSQNVPHILTTTGATETTNLQNAYSANPNQYTSRIGIKARQITKMPVDNKIYGHKTVKAQLVSEQHGKCCFCEAKFTDHSYGDVEHFRPKKAYKKRGERKLTYPGYYWLAYDWYNLMFSCEKCNRKYKRNDFPLDNESSRKSNHNSPNQLKKEDRLLINPIEEDPSLFITFNEEVPVEVGGSLKGSTSIKAYGLERLNDSRLEYLNELGAALAFIEINSDAKIQNAMDAFNFTRRDVLKFVADATQLFNTAAKDTAKFAYCVRCKFPALPIR